MTANTQPTESWSLVERIEGIEQSLENLCHSNDLLAHDLFAKIDAAKNEAAALASELAKARETIAQHKFAVDNAARLNAEQDDEIEAIESELAKARDSLSVKDEEWEAWYRPIIAKKDYEIAQLLGQLAAVGEIARSRTKYPFPVECRQLAVDVLAALATGAATTGQTCANCGGTGVITYDGWTQDKACPTCTTPTPHGSGT